MKNPFSNAGDAGSIPGLGTKIPHTEEQLSPGATPGEACVPQQRPSTAKKIKGGGDSQFSLKKNSESEAPRGK